MERGSHKHGPRQDEELKHELEALERSNRPARTEEWRDPEGPADDDPQPSPVSAPRLRPEDAADERVDPS